MKEIVVNSKKHGSRSILVDEQDYILLSSFHWYIKKKCSTFYALANINGKKIRMHRLILGIVNPKIIVDHIDHNGLNNQRNNLREATPGQNSANSKSHINSTSAFLGVSYCKNINKWRADICKNGKKKSLGTYSKESEAAIAYNNAAMIVHGVFANLNKVG